MGTAGVENPTVIDFVGHNAETDEVTLAMIEERNWDGSKERVLQVQTKINNYLSFVLDGQYLKKYPDYKNKKVVFQLYCSFAPDFQTCALLDHMERALSDYNIEWKVKLLSSNG